MTLKIVTANRLRDGKVVFLKTDGGWTEQVSQSCTATEDETAEALLATADAPAQKREVVGPYLIDATLEDGQVRPVRYRERLRTLGPSVETTPTASKATG